MIPKFIILAAFFVFVYSRESGKAPLDPDVFQSLDDTKLKPLKGNHSQDNIFMHYVLYENIIEKVSAQYGIFKLDGPGKLYVQLLETNGALNGEFHTIIRRRTLRKYLTLPIIAQGEYKAKLFNATLTFTLDLPKGPGQKMNLSSCFTDVLQLELDLDATSGDDNKSLKQLRFWLRNAMLPSFSELFCEAMERVLEQGSKSDVVRALQGRLCHLLGPIRCAQFMKMLSG